MFTQQQITDFWNQVSEGEIVEGITKVASENDTICIRIDISQNVCYSRRSAEHPWEEIL